MVVEDRAIARIVTPRSGGARTVVRVSSPHPQDRATEEDPRHPTFLFVGIDVSNERLDTARRPSGEQWATPNDARGISTICRRLQKRVPALIVLEATGGLEMPLVGALAAAGRPVVVVNPRQVRDFAKTTGRPHEGGAHRLPA